MVYLSAETAGVAWIAVDAHPTPAWALGTIPAGQVKAFWVRRAAAYTAALSNDGVTIAVTGDTGSL